MISSSLLDKKFFFRFHMYQDFRNCGQSLKNFGPLAEFVGKRAVEKAAPWKSPRAGLSPSA
jgi:hypothetical protein